MNPLNIILDESEFARIQYFNSESSLTQADVLNCATALATHSPSRINGVQQGICILMSRSAQYIAAIFVAWRAGLYVVPLNTAWPAQKNFDIIDRIQPAAVLLDDGASLDIVFPVLTTSELFATQADAFNEYSGYPAGLLLTSDVAYVIFSSGSTSEPKGVVIGAGAFRAYIDWTRRFFDTYAGAQRLLLTSELAFDVTMGDIAFALAFGTAIGVARNNTNSASMLAMIMRHQIELLYSVLTTHLSLVAFARQQRGAVLSTLRLILSGGDRFPWQLAHDYVSLIGGAHFYNVCGPTEVTINCFAVRIDDKLELEAQGKPLPVGDCFDSLDHVLLDDRAEQVVLRVAA